MENDQHNALNVHLEIKRVPAQLIVKDLPLHVNKTQPFFSINN